MEETKPEKNNPHAILFPYPYQGHIAPAVSLATALASSGFTVTFVQLEFLHRTIFHDGDPFAGAREAGLDLRYTTVSDGFPVEFDRGLNFEEYWEGMISGFPDRADEVVGNIMTSSSVDFFLVADTLYAWSAEVARKHGIVNVSLWTESAAMFSIYVYHHLDFLSENGRVPFTGNDDDELDYIPGLHFISKKDVLSYIKEYLDAFPLVTKVVAMAFEQVKTADFILYNTVRELEPGALDALNREQPIYHAIGPINFFSNVTRQALESMSFRPQSDCIGWLDSKPPGSVLYISFGSIVQMGELVVREMAHGLVLSRVNFVWVLSGDGSDVFTDADAVNDQGLVVPWCNQSAVLCHPAVGGFLTHCGWNSVLEGVWAGVPMICHPFFIDQPMNRKLVVEDWKIGINLCDDADQVTKEEFASKVDLLMRGERCIELRKEANKVKEMARNALEMDGSSCKSFDRFVADLKAKLACNIRDA